LYLGDRINNGNSVLNETRKRWMFIDQAVVKQFCRT